jgi:hypothetical protein
MVIITNGNNAVMYYSESQWLDAEDSDFPAEDWGFRVPNSTVNNYSILGSPEIINPDGTVTPATPPMSQTEVQGISTAVLFQPAPVEVSE